MTTTIEIKITKICKGYYETTIDGKIWCIEHVTKNDGFAYDEWHFGTEEDAHGDQANTKRECVDALNYMANHPEEYS